MKIPYGRQHIADEDIQAVVDVLKSDFLTQGPMVEIFEWKMAEFVGAGHAAAVTNGTAALHLAALALGVGPGDKVLVPTNSFVASANCIRYCGGDVEFVDIDAQTRCLDLNLVEKKLAAKPRGFYKGIVSVDFAGYPVDYESLRALADRHGVWILQDACHAVGAEFQDSRGAWQKIGSGKYSDMTVFSFHPVKHIATGEGGMVTSNNSELVDKVKLLRTHGIQREPKELFAQRGGWYYEMPVLGYNYRISDVLCVLGISQLSRIESNLVARRRIADIYFNEMQNLPITMQKPPNTVKHGYHLFVIETDHRGELYEFLKTKEIYSQVHYIPIHCQPYYVELYGKQSLPVAEKYYTRTLSLPMYHSLSDADHSRVLQAMQEFFR